MTSAPLLLAMAMAGTTPANDSISLSPVTVEAQAVTVSMRGDTLVFCVANFMEHRYERLRALLQNLPGVEVTADGTIKAKGRAVDHLLINGRKLTGIKESTVIDNLRAEALVSIKLYDEASERDRETGMVNGKEEQVMDLVTKEDKRHGWLVDMTAGGGTHERYSANASASRFSEEWQNMFTATLDNLPGTLGIGESYYDKLQKTVPTADAHRRNVSGLAGWENESWKIDASAYYDGSKSEDGSRSIFETMLPGMESVQYIHDDSRNKSHTVSMQLGLEWHDSLTTIHIDPFITWTRSEGYYHHQSHTVNEKRQKLNNQYADNNSSTRSLDAELGIRLNHKLRSKRGRNIDVALGLNTNRQDEVTANGNIISYLMPPVMHTRSLRLSDGITNRSGMQLRLSYVEPLLESLKLQAEYVVGYRMDDADNPVYQVDNADFGVQDHKHLTRNDSLSRDANNRELAQRGRVVMQLSRGKVRMSIGGVVDAGNAHTKYERHKLNLDTIHNTVDWSPELHLTWRGEDGWSFTATYDGRTLHPSILDLIPVEDSSDPLNIRCGNPGLKNAFMHTMNISFFFFSPTNGRQFNLQIGGDLEQRSLTQSVSYDAKSGVRRYSTINVDGNRRADGSWGFQTPMGASHDWYLDLQGDVHFARKVGEQDVDGGNPYSYATRQTQVMQYGAVQFKRWGMSVKPYGYGQYERLRSSLDGALERDTYTFGYGGVVRYDSSFGLSLAVDVYNHCRRGYAETMMNKDEVIIDAELSFAFLRGRNAELSLMACDMLGQRDMLRHYTATSGRSEHLYEKAVNSYAMATFTYRF